jgi:UDP-3-O-[3-hydroxymyristoyl] glucosamine N-acyltransferase
MKENLFLKKNTNIQDVLRVLKDSDIEFDYCGDVSIEILGFSSLNKVEKNTIIYCDNPTSIKSKDNVLIAKSRDFCANSIVVDDPKLVFYKLSNLIKFENNSFLRSIDPSCDVGENVVIGNCHIGKDVKIGHNVVLGDGTFVGDGTVIDSNCSIGCLGISWTWDGNEKVFLKSYGNTMIGENCVISSNVKIVRGIFTDNTVLGNSVFVAPGVAVGHSTIIKDQVHIANNCTIGGSCVVGENSFLGCGSTIASGAKLENEVVLGAGCVATPSQVLSSKSVYIGIPAKKIKTIGDDYSLKSIPRKEKK